MVARPLVDELNRPEARRGVVRFTISVSASTVARSASVSTPSPASRKSASPADATRSDEIVLGTPETITRLSKRFLIHVTTRM